MTSKCTHINSSAWPCLSRCYMWRLQHSTRHPPSLVSSAQTFISHFNKHPFVTYIPCHVFFYFCIQRSPLLTTVCWKTSIKIWSPNAYFLIFIHSEIRKLSIFATILGSRHVKTIILYTSKVAVLVELVIAKGI